jgi:asparagine synthetase B (glutamine-hydrolysing)
LRFVDSAFESDECTLVSFAREAMAATQSQMARHPHTRAVLLLEGEIYNWREMSRRYLSGETSVPSVLLDAYTEIGPRFVEKLDGEFNIAIYEPAASRLSIFTDHLGSNPIYQWQAGKEFMFGSEKKCLLAASGHERKLDPIGLLQPFVHQHNLGDRTLIEGLRRIPPSSRLMCMTGRVEVTEYGLGLWQEPARVAAAEMLAKWEHELKSATAKRVNGKSRLLISLSSGLDSRAVACALDRGKRPVWARTMGHIDSFEARYAAEIARALNFQHDIENSLEFRHSDVVRRIVWRTDGETDFRNGLSMFTHGRTRQLGDDILGGWLGDVSSGAHLRPFMLRPMARAEFIKKVFRWYIQHDVNELKQVFAETFLAKHWLSVRDAFDESYEPFGGLPNTSAHELWDIRNRQTRMTISSMPVDSHLFGKVRPFFDRQYLRFTSSIPLKWRIGQNLYKSLIYRIGPEIRAIPNGNTNLKLHQMPTANLIGYGRTIGNRVIDRIRRRLPLPIVDRNKDKMSADLALHFRRDDGLREIVNQFVRSSYCDEEIFNRSAITDMVTGHFNGLSDRSELISILATYAVALEYFVYERKTTCPDGALPIL